MNSGSVRSVLIPVDEYERLLRRAVRLPKDHKLPPLTDKQKFKVNEAMLDACVVNVSRKDAHLQPAPVQDMVERTLH